MISTPNPSTQPATAAPLPPRGRLRAGAVRLALTTLAGLLLGGIVHIVTVLLIPALSQHDAAHAYGALGATGRTELVSVDRGTVPAVLEGDRQAVTAVCAYDLASGPLRVTARTGTLPLGVTLHRRTGGVLYAITDRAAIRGVLEFVVLTEAQRDERVADDEEGETSRELRVVSDSERGLVVIRVLAKQAADRPDAEALATGVQCGPAG